MVRYAPNNRCDFGGGVVAGVGRIRDIDSVSIGSSIILEGDDSFDAVDDDADGNAHEADDDVDDDVDGLP